MGYLLENSPGIEGHQHVFWMLAIFSFVGGIAAWYYHRLYGKKGVKVPKVWSAWSLTTVI
jgi:hypothetical protein